MQLEKQERQRERGERERETPCAATLMTPGAAQTSGHKKMYLVQAHSANESPGISLLPLLVQYLPQMTLEVRGRQREREKRKMTCVQVDVCEQKKRAFSPISVSDLLIQVGQGDK